MAARPAILDHASTLADVNRCRVLQLLDRNELTVSELCRILQLPQSTVSRHLKILGDGGWIRSRRDGTSHLYRGQAGSPGNGAGELWDLIRQQTADLSVVRQDRRRLDRILQQRRTRSREFFSSGAGQWDSLRDELFGSHFDLLALPGLCDPKWTVGDLGCGTGRLTEALAAFVRRVIAVDGSAEMLKAARQRLSTTSNIDFRKGELEDLPIKSEALDAATLVLALHHVAEPGKVLGEAHRVLKRGGRLLVIDMLPHDREEYRQQMGHIWLGFSEEQIRREWHAAGFCRGHVRPLPPVPEAKGPSLFAAVLTR